MASKNYPNLLSDIIKALNASEKYKPLEELQFNGLKVLRLQHNIVISDGTIFIMSLAKGHRPEFICLCVEETLGKDFIFIKLDCGEELLSHCDNFQHGLVELYCEGFVVAFTVEELKKVRKKLSNTDVFEILYRHVLNVVGLKMSKVDAINICGVIFGGNMNSIKFLESFDAEETLPSFMRMMYDSEISKKTGFL